MLGFFLARTGRLAGLFLLIVGCAHWTRGSEVNSPPAAFPQVTNLSQLLNLAGTMQNALLPVHLEGVVCWMDQGGSLVALQADSRLAFLEIDLSNGSVRAGDSVVIEGNCLVQHGKFNLRLPPVVDNDGVHGIMEKAGTVFLRVGKHPLRVRWFDKGGDCALQVAYEGPNLPRQDVPATALFRAVPDQAGGATNWVQGLEYRAYEGEWERLPDFAALKPVRQGNVAGFDLNVRTRTNNVGLEFAGFLEVPHDGLYTFYTRSDDGSRLSLDEQTPQVVVRANRAFPHPRQVVPGQRFLPEERQWSEVEGKATFISRSPHGLVVELSSVRGHLTAIVPEPSRLAISLLSDAQLRLRGVCQGIYVASGQPIAGRLLVPSPDMVEVLSLPPLRWVAYPISPIAAKPVAPPDEDEETIVHLRGNVRAITTARDFTLADATGSVSVETLQPMTVKAGTEVEVLGRWRQTAANIVLASALWRGTDRDPEELARLTTIEQVRTMKREDARRRYPVHIRGVVTYARLGTADGVIQDSTGGVYVQDLAPPGFVPLQVGDYMEVEGETGPGDFAPLITARQVTPLGRGQLPNPVHPTWDQLMSGSADCQYAEFDGMITSVQETSLHLLLREGHLEVVVPDYEVPELARLENAHVRLRGCLLAKWDQATRRATAGAIQLRTVTAHVEAPAPKDLFALPAKRIGEMQQFDAHAGALERVKVSGQVLHCRDGEHFLTDGTNGLRFLLRTPAGLRVGEQVEVVGFPELGGPSPLLREAVARKTGSADLPLPRRLGPETLLGGSNDAMLVEVDCRLVGLRSTPTEQLLELQNGPRAFLARLDANSGPMKPVSIGSTLRLRGVYAARGGTRAAGGNNDSFELLLNGPADIQILAEPPWWTPQHTSAVVGSLAGVLLLAAVWILALRRQVDRRTKELREEIEERKRTEAKLSAEIVERKRMEQQVEKTHQELLIASREAGMAEVATSVLHNIGNVLNSAYVSASLLVQRVRESKVASLAKAADLIRGHEQEFPELVAQDPKLKKLPGYLVQVADHLSAEQAQTLDELRSLANSMEHIRQTVMMQQSYARISGVIERVHPKELVEDALRICLPTLEQHGINLKREYDESAPEIKVDRYKALQILVNLVRNAGNACADSGRLDKKLVVRLARRDGCVRIAVVDNGVGIAPENLTRIFNQGFTTRENGRGFGLHSGALAAKELGGALVAHSDGAGKGAVFTLELPLTQADDKNVPIYP